MYRARRGVGEVGLMIGESRVVSRNNRSDHHVMFIYLTSAIDWTSKQAIPLVIEVVIPFRSCCHFHCDSTLLRGQFAHSSSICPLRATQILAPSLVAYITMPRKATPAALHPAACVRRLIARAVDATTAAPGESGVVPLRAVQRTAPRASLPHNFALRQFCCS